MTPPERLARCAQMADEMLKDLANHYFARLSAEFGDTAPDPRETALAEAEVLGAALLRATITMRGIVERRRAQGEGWVPAVSEDKRREQSALEAHYRLGEEIRRGR